MGVTPNALSVGRLVVKEGCSFHWVPGHRPQLTLPDGTVVKLRVKRYAPFLPHGIDDPDDIVHPDDDFQETSWLIQSR